MSDEQEQNVWLAFERVLREQEEKTELEDRLRRELFTRRMMWLAWLVWVIAAILLFLIK